MQVLVEMSSSETMQPPGTVKDNTEEATFLVPLVASPLKQGAQPRATKQGSEQPPVPRAPRNGFQGKRRNSLNIGFKHPAPFKRRRRVNSDCDPVLPSKFLLGGNIFDPLNLNSLLDEEVNRALNAETPKSSPLPSRNRDPVEILIPKDITDPLSLNAASGDVELLLSPLKSGRKRHRHRHHQPSDAVTKTGSGLEKETEPIPEELRPYELNTAINCRDEVVPPPALVSDVTVPAPAASAAPGSRHRKRRRTSSKSEGRQGSPERIKSTVTVPSKTQCSKPQTPSKSKNRFQYGNYCQYYGYRNPNWTEDSRLQVLRPEWFRGKTVLDIGCNVGHLTLCVAKNMGASRVVGLDIDGHLVHAARQNIRHYLSEGRKVGSVFPSSLVATRGPIAAPSFLLKRKEEEKNEFPHNVVFLQGNYVVDQEELVEAQKPEYDVILCLSVTKWVHLNWGDDGLRRMFRRMYRHLNPGGILVLEPQPWSSYGKRKKLTDTIFRNYSKISLKPQQFTSYLLSPEVGFYSYELIATPHAQAKGFQRPIYVFYKNSPATSSTGTREEPMDTQEKSRRGAEEPPAGPRGAVTQEEPPAGPRGPVTREEPPAGPRGPVTREEPPAGPRGPVTREEPPAGPRGPVTQEEPPAGPRGPVTQEEPPAGPRGPVTQEEPPAGPRGPVTQKEPPAGPHGAVTREEPMDTQEKSRRGAEEPLAGPRVAVTREEPPAGPRVAVTQEEPPVAPHRTVSVLDN